MVARGPARSRQGRAWSECLAGEPEAPRALVSGARHRGLPEGEHAPSRCLATQGGRCWDVAGPQLARSARRHDAGSVCRKVSRPAEPEPQAGGPASELAAAGSASGAPASGSGEASRRAWHGPERCRPRGGLEPRSSQRNQQASAWPLKSAPRERRQPLVGVVSSKAAGAKLAFSVGRSAHLRVSLSLGESRRHDRPQP